jgi:hypothetical protein
LRKDSVGIGLRERMGEEETGCEGRRHSSVFGGGNFLTGSRVGFGAPATAYRDENVAGDSRALGPNLEAEDPSFLRARTIVPCPAPSSAWADCESSYSVGGRRCLQVVRRDSG